MKSTKRWRGRRKSSNTEGNRSQITHEGKKSNTAVEKKPTNKRWERHQLTQGRKETNEHRGGESNITRWKIKQLTKGVKIIKSHRGKKKPSNTVAKVNQVTQTGIKIK